MLSNLNPDTSTAAAFTSQAVALTIAGSDPSGGAGLQADLKTFQQLGVYGMSVVTLLTVQNTQSVSHVETLAEELILAQLDAVLADIPPQVIKSGALGNASIVKAVADRLSDVACPIVVDPVLVSKHGHSLADDDVVQAYIDYLLPQAYLITPNRFETERLTGIELTDDTSAREAAMRLHARGAEHVLIKLGEHHHQSHHLLSLPQEMCDLVTPRLPSGNTHGTGCILSAAIAAKLALGEKDIRHAVNFGIARVLETIQTNTRLGQGIHPAEIRAMRRPE